MEEQWLEWGWFHMQLWLFLEFFRESFRHFLVHTLEVWEEGPYLTSLLIDRRAAWPLKVSENIPQSNEGSHRHSLYFSWRQLSPHQVRFPCQWLVAGLRTQATHDALIKPLAQCLSHSRHPISFWWPLYHMQTFAGDVMSLCHSFLPPLPSVFLSHSL